MFTERTQVLLSPEQRRRLERMAAREGRSVGAMIREAIESYTAVGPRSRTEAAEALIAMNLPIGDWEEIKGEIAASKIEGLPEVEDRTE
ncbi:MAG: CopG family transcriptional regulator [Candidatus Limnocylindria bacterium]